MGDPIRFNVNDYVRVRLTDRGRQILRAKNDKLREIFPLQKWLMPAVDEDGFSRWQLWDLMAQFGEHIRLGGEVPFETTILIGDDK